MKRTIRLAKVLLLALVLAGFGITRLQGKPEDTKKEKTPCITCHVKNGAKELNDVGKCYQKKRTLKECKSPENKPAEKK